MQTTTFESPPSLTQEAAIAVATAMAGRGAPAGMKAKITSVQAYQVDGQWIATASVEFEADLEASLEPEDLTEKKDDGKQEGEGSSENNNTGDIYYMAFHGQSEGVLPELPLDDGPSPAQKVMEQDPLLASQNNDDQNTDQEDPATPDTETGPETLADDALIIADQLKADFNEPLNNPDIDKVENLTPEELELRRLAAENYVPPAEEPVRPEPLT